MVLIDRVREEILRQGLLYRGTDNKSFNKKRNEGFFYDDYEGFNGYKTIAYSHVCHAMAAGVSSCFGNGASPVLFGIMVGRYVDSLDCDLQIFRGSMLPAMLMVKIACRVSFDDVVEIVSLADLTRMCQGLRPENVSYFVRRFINR